MFSMKKLLYPSEHYLLSIEQEADAISNQLVNILDQLKSQIFPQEDVETEKQS